MADLVRRTVSTIIGTVSGVQVSNPSQIDTHSGAVAGADLDAGDVVRFNSSFAYILADATTTTNNKTYGVVLARAKSGEAVTVLQEGRMSGWAGLVPGPVYLSDNPGQISQSAGTTSKMVGWAVNATTVQFSLIPN